LGYFVVISWSIGFLARTNDLVTDHCDCPC